MTKYRSEILKQVEPIVVDNLKLLKSVEKSWQPADYLPDPNSEPWHEALQNLQSEAEGIPDEIFVTLVGNMITEEALPSYQTWTNRIEGVGDMSGTDSSPWALWSRGWTAEENRHGDLLNRYLYLSRRVDMRTVEITIQHLIRHGFNSGTDNNLYRSFIFTSFQERATKISHRNVARHAEFYGDSTLGKICGVIASDEARHETAYKNLVKRIFEIDPAGGVLEFEATMRSRVTMPGSGMNDGKTDNLYGLYSLMAQYTGVYTHQDYAEIMDYLIDYWGVSTLGDLTPEASQAQEYLCRLPDRYRKLSSRFEKIFKTRKEESLPWVIECHKRSER